ncbi:MAG: NAD(P)-dependent glycerol-3-phosphate dehydrogenase [Proteobacteria bacterium]|nr:NAD(P)-dependent glycerol-3-phosphate dehydrogenase [Pseudomonadota bacterium]MDA1023002.1 NAD(P)-dependent glycerol-3-phosphate dehydrogenase [Pseudomonadota bacterium]
MKKISIIGAGAWGTALAAVACRAGMDVVIQAQEEDVARAINDSHENTTFLAGVTLDAAIRATTDMADATAGAEAVILAAPAQFLRPVMENLKAHLTPGIPAVICAKGIELDSGALMSEIAAEVAPQTPIAVLSGPTFAAEVARDLPAAVTLAAEDEKIATQLSDALGTNRFRIYRSDDVIGAQVGGAVKNVLAIGCGIIEGRGLGDNARAALITRGLAEIVRLGTAKGAKAETLMGLCGIGDLVLTCNAMQSRNFSLGVALGQGEPLADILGARTSVAEGVFSAASVTELAGRLNIDMPISLAVDGILNHFADIDASIEGLLSRPAGVEEKA